jgi:GH25 family lysozyme M1 (1,4-beta-N-acetylmuramidase)
MFDASAFDHLRCASCVSRSGTNVRAQFPRGFDVYTGDGVVNWTTAKNSGISFAFVKSSEGINAQDSKFTSNMTNSAAAGVPVGPYHVCRVNSKNGVPFTTYDGLPFPVNSDPWLDATSEARDFISRIRPYYQSGSYLPPVADIETSIIEALPFSTANRKLFTSYWLQIFSDVVNNALGVRPIIYTSKSSANTYYTPAIANNHKLWIAWWKGTGTTSPPLQSDTPTWPLWTFWQYTNLESVPGVPGSEGPPTYDKEDGDVFNGTQQQLAALLIHRVAGDYNRNGVVDTGDYVAWRNSMGSTIDLAADGNNNGVVDSGDFSYWRARLGNAAGSGAAVPEPGVVALAVIGVSVCCRPHRGQLQRRLRFPVL